MKKNLLLVSILVIAACNTTKKNTTVASATTNSTPSEVLTGSVVSAKSRDGIYAPGEEELKTIQLSYPEVTLAQLQTGHTLYTKGACVTCHDPKNIYRYTETMWKEIIDDMAFKAKITANEKEAVHKYILAIKAKQP